MKNLALGVVLAGLVVACTSGKNNNTVQLIDSPTADTGGGACNPIMQSGCNAGEKCTWINDQDNPPVGHVGCAPEGSPTIPIDGMCTPPVGGPMGYDTCIKGSVCLSGVCKRICDQAAASGSTGCDADHECQRYADFFVVGGTTVAGVCDPQCDPLTQDLKVGANKTACGSVMATAPNQGCYGYSQFSCARVTAPTLLLTDRMVPRSSAAGNPYLNGCAPGFIPLVYEMTGSMNTLCTGLCAALETDSTVAHMNNEKGDATALAKLPLDAAAAAGNATCQANKKGSEASSVCKYLWPALVDSMGNLDMTQYTDTLGYCVALAHYQYDSNSDMIPDAPFPHCNTLPPRGTGTPTTTDDAADWGCQKVANSMFTAQPGKHIKAPDLAPAMRDFRVGQYPSVELERHIVH